MAVFPVNYPHDDQIAGITTLGDIQRNLATVNAMNESSRGKLIAQFSFTLEGSRNTFKSS